MQLEFEKEVYNLYLDYMNIEDNDISYKMFIWDVLYDVITNYKKNYNNIDEFNIEFWERNDLKFYGIRHKKDNYEYWFYEIDREYTIVETENIFTTCLVKLKDFLLNNRQELDLTVCKKGDKLLLRNGEIVIFDKIDIETDTNYIIDALYETGHNINFKKNGKYWGNTENDRDVIKILN